jgi:hypothetical protein
MFKADLAREYVVDPELKQFLSDRSAMVRNGAVFPDTGYAADHAYGEYAHWADFLNISFGCGKIALWTIASGASRCERIFWAAFPTVWLMCYLIAIL